MDDTFELVQLNVQDGVEDCTHIEFALAGESLFFENHDFRFTVSSLSPQVVLHVNADDGTVPMVIVEEGYEWVPVYSRKLV